MHKAGVNTADAKTVVDALITTSLRGVESHGIRLLPHYLRGIMLGRINPKPKFIFTKTMSATGLLDADDGLGILAGYKAMDHAVTMAKKVGMGAVSVRNSSHFAAAGLYTMMAAKNDTIGIAVTHVEALVLPYNGKEPFLGTNAFSFAVPCAGETPIVLDMATTNMSLNKLNMYKAAGKEIPEGWAADAKGRMTTDPRAAHFLTHFGGYKGYGISLMVEILSSLLSGMEYGPHISPMFPLNGAKRKLGHFFMAINIAGFEKPVVFKRRMHALADELRAIPSVSSKTSVMVAGDPEKKIFEKRSQTGLIAMPKTDYEALMRVATALGVDGALTE